MHGSCAAVYNSSIANTTIEQYNYFTTAIELYKKYNITKILENSNIRPSNSKGYKVRVDNINYSDLKLISNFNFLVGRIFKCISKQKANDQMYIRQ